MMPLDVCPGFEDDPADIMRATELTHRWAEKAFDAWQARPESYHGHSQTLFGIVQGGYTEAGRRESAKAIASLGFPGWAIGGLVTAEPISTTWQLVAAAVSELPASGPRYLMGVGTPADIVRAVALGVDMFDCVLPTRNARNGSVFTNSGTLNLRSAQYADDQGPIDPECDCPVCRRHSRAYVRHLLRCNEITGLVLTTIHSVYFYISLMSRIRSSIQDGSFASWADNFLATYEQFAGEKPAERKVSA
jgi:queuine tRNA-ribosyltransferase